MMYVILLNMLMLMLIAVMELAAIYDAVKGKDNETYQNEEK